MHDFLVSDAINDRLRSLHLLHGSALVAGDNGLLHFFDGGAQLGAQCCIVGALLVVLTGALFSLGGVCHGGEFFCA